MTHRNVANFKPIGSRASSTRCFHPRVMQASRDKPSTCPPTHRAVPLARKSRAGVPGREPEDRGPSPSAGRHIFPAEEGRCRGSPSPGVSRRRCRPPLLIEARSAITAGCRGLASRLPRAALAHANRPRPFEVRTRAVSPQALVGYALARRSCGRRPRKRSGKRDADRRERRTHDDAPRAGALLALFILGARASQRRSEGDGTRQRRGRHATSSYAGRGRGSLERRLAPSSARAAGLFAHASSAAGVGGRPRHRPRRPRDPSPAETC